MPNFTTAYRQPREELGFVAANHTIKAIKYNIVLTYLFY